MSEREADLARAETQAATVESNLGVEIDRLSHLAAEMQARLSALTEAARRVHGTPEAASLAARVEKTPVPRLDVFGEREQALAARARALEVRAQANEKVRKALAGYTAELTRLSAQVSEDEAELARIEVRTKEEAKRREVRPPPAPAPLRAMQERSTRVQMQAAVDLHSDTNFFNGFSTNISDGGLFIATVRHLPIGTEVDLGFTLPSGQHVEATGRVRWTRETNDRTPDVFPGLGIQFVNLSEGARSAIHEFVSSREPMFFPD
ncbi:MAG: TIGR02266 family protein [Myxococcota bacterium]